MAGSSQPQHFFAAGCLFADFAIAVIFYPVIKTLWKFVCILFAFCHTQILNLRAKINFANMLKIVQKLGQPLNLPDFRIIFNIGWSHKGLWMVTHLPQAGHSISPELSPIIPRMATHHHQELGLPSTIPRVFSTISRQGCSSTFSWMLTKFLRFVNYPPHLLSP